jgi:hypothetical protein
LPQYAFRNPETEKGGRGAERLQGISNGAYWLRAFASMMVGKASGAAVVVSGSLRACVQRWRWLMQNRLTTEVERGADEKKRDGKQMNNPEVVVENIIHV